MTNTVLTEIQSLAPSAMVELFVLDLSKYSQPTVYFHAGTNAVQQNVTWQGQVYVALPIEAEGFDLLAKGVLPRPLIRIANINGVLSAEVSTYNDLVGCKVTRKRTFARFLDAVNFTGGVNAEADPNQHLNDDNWYIERKTNENRYVIEWELVSAFDLQGVMLPKRQILQNTCAWFYRSSECGYVGTNYFDTANTPCAVGADACGKRLSSCLARFPNMPVPFGAFPGARVNG